uniref:BHLH domain-containing protein n=1 Tax=Panagrellus redivivus TaxID=6233 RepID=A0A7E4ZXL7_PANRE
MAMVFPRSSTPVPELLQPYQCPLKRVLARKLVNVAKPNGLGFTAPPEDENGRSPGPSEAPNPDEAKMARKRIRKRLKYFRRFESKCRRIAHDLITSGYLRRLQSSRVARSLAIEFIDRSMAATCPKLGLAFALSALRIHQIHKRRQLGSRLKRKAILQVANRLRIKHLGTLMEMAFCE